METRSIGQGTKTVLELGPIGLFLAAYLLLKDRTFLVGGVEYSGFIAVTAGFIPVLLAATVVLWRLTGKLSRMQVVTAVLVVIFGGMSVWFNDERFFKIKPTIIYLLFAGILGVGLLRGKSPIQYVMAENLPLTDRGWLIFTRNFTFMFLAMAVANELIWRNLSTEVWVYFKTLGTTIVIAGFIFVQTYILMYREAMDEAAAESTGESANSGSDE